MRGAKQSLRSPTACTRFNVSMLIPQSRIGRCALTAACALACGTSMSEAQRVPSSALSRSRSAAAGHVSTPSMMAPTARLGSWAPYPASSQDPRNHPTRLCDERWEVRLLVSGAAGAAMGWLVYKILAGQGASARSRMMLFLAAWVAVGHEVSCIVSRNRPPSVAEPPPRPDPSPKPVPVVRPRRDTLAVANLRDGLPSR